MKFIIWFVSAMGILRGFMLFYNAYTRKEDIPFRPLDVIVRDIPDDQKSRIAKIIEGIFFVVGCSWLLVSFL